MCSALSIIYIAKSFLLRLLTVDTKILDEQKIKKGKKFWGMSYEKVSFLEDIFLGDSLLGDDFPQVTF